MLKSELIKELQESIEEYGDSDIKTCVNTGWNYSNYHEIKLVNVKRLDNSITTEIYVEHEEER